MTQFKQPVISITFVLIICAIFFSTAKGDQCLKGPYHTKVAGPSKETFTECQPWQKNSCCTLQFTASLQQHETRKLYNHSWHVCGQLSRQCQQYWVMQECFYQCSPYVAPFEDPDYNGGLKGVPICSRYCDSWYEACKDDLICVENVLQDYNFTSAGENNCPFNKQCVSYKQMYGSGEKLCNKMWGHSYTYTTENKEATNCMLMWFDPRNGNPNANVKSVDHNDIAGNGFELKATSVMLAFFSVVVVSFLHLD